MERFWNIIYYFAYRVDYKLHLVFNKINPIFYIYKLPFCKRHFEKKGYDPVEKVNEAFKRPDIGLSSIFSFGFVFGGKVFFLLGLFMCFPNKDLPIMLLVASCVIAFVFDYILLLHKDKYLKYFKEFDKKPCKWKVKWAWISLGVILFHFVFFFVAGFVLNPYFKGI